MVSKSNQDNKKTEEAKASEEKSAEEFDNAPEPVDVDEDWRTKQIATDFAVSLLQNPNIERYLRNPPLSAAEVEDGLSQGQWLAKKCRIMAQDFINELDKQNS